ncbi:MAG: type II toxin-antitoxin system RelE/ParE family toxin [Chitinivibrionales bacterium]|nr:type II toxin-antitoxin system RelE/ParE family toxin [Chitinivibrionales bacterium]
MELFYYQTEQGRIPVKEYIDALEKEDRAKIIADFELIRKYGLKDAPVSTRKLQGGQFKGKLWEIKTGKSNQHRIFYCILLGTQLHMLHACKKQKEGGQNKDLDTALKRLKKII